ncbi:MAG: T9SS type A sorting domain-containing protein [Bacteroidetes bacterium]|nr:T9SS type A sorting domain-containing protein [Bacteroidota bacterium]
MKKTLTVLFVILGMYCNLYSQDKIVQRNTAVERAPIVNQNFDGNGNSTVLNYGARWFGQNAATTSFFNKGFLTSAAAHTNFGPSSTSLFGAMEFDNNGVLYCIAVAAGSPLQTLDTTTGVLTTLGAISGIGSEQVLGMSFNPVNNKMYISTITSGLDNLYTLDLVTRVATLVGPTGQNMFDIGINSTGQCYAISVADNLISVNLTTGAGTIIGPIGFDANFIQGICFDRSTDTLWYAAYNNSAGQGQLRTVNLTTGATTLVGIFSPAAEVCGFTIQGKKAYPLNAFNILTPAAGARVVTVAGSTTPVTITWDTSASGATYKWIFGNPVVPPRRITIPAANNSITTTLGALDAILAANGFTNNGSASDSAVGQWNVYAYKGSGATGPDSLISTNGPRAITLRRQQVLLSPFTLVSPPSGTRIVTSPVDLSPVNITWNRSGLGAAYKWLFKSGATYTDPATLRLASNNSGLDSVLTLRNSQLDSVLAGLGIAAGDSVVGQWRVRAYASTDSLNSTAPDRSITFRRTGLLPLSQDFSNATFPPPFWGLDNGGGSTQYWTRNTVSAWGLGTGSAKYDFWSATTSTPLQTLTSNQFPPVTAPSNYLRFNYTHAFYLSGSTLAPDSCIIETSADGGSTWTRLIGMGASQTISSGTNSSPIMTTVGGPVSGAFTPTSTQWATKVFAMPIGTNKVRFVAKSGFGNNLYIDDITSGLITGINNTPITMTPDRFELSQNYPNPFNPSTKISFSIPKQSFVSLKIYDMLGKEVSQLVSEVKTPGVYSIDFNALNLSSGAYFYQLKAGEFSDIKRMVLIK